MVGILELKIVKNVKNAQCFALWSQRKYELKTFVFLLLVPPSSWFFFLNWKLITFSDFKYMWINLALILSEDSKRRPFVCCTVPPPQRRARGCGPKLKICADTPRRGFPRMYIDFDQTNNVWWLRCLFFDYWIWVRIKYKKSH